MQRRIVIMATAAALMWLGLSFKFAPASAQSQETFKGRLAPVPVDAKTRPDVAGFGNASAVLAGAKLTVSGTFTDFKVPATVARLRSAIENRATPRSRANIEPLQQRC